MTHHNGSIPYRAGDGRLPCGKTRTHKQAKTEERLQTEAQLCEVLASVEREAGRKGVKAGIGFEREHLSLAAESFPVGVWEYDVPSGMVRHDARCDTMLGFHPSHGATTFATWMSSIHEEDRDRVVAKFTEYLEGKSGGYAEEYRMHAASDEWRWLLSRGEVVERDCDGRAVRILGTRMDVTGRKGSEKALRDSEMRCEEVSELAYDFLSKLRTALTNIEDLSRLLQEGYSGSPYGKVQECVTAIGKHAEQTRELIDPLLDVFKPALTGAEDSPADTITPVRQACKEVRGAVSNEDAPEAVDDPDQSYDWDWI